MAVSITGMAKILYKNYLLGVNLSGITVSTGTASFLNDNDRDTSWSSVGSNDAVTESIEITFLSAQSINRIMAITMNWKQYTCQYWNGSSYVDFTNVYSKKADTVTTGISSTTNTDTTRYWEFDTVSTLKVKFTITKTISANQDKTCVEIYVGKEIGTFIDDPTSKPNDVDMYFEQGDKTIELSNMGVYQILSGKKFRCKWKLKAVAETVDRATVASMLGLNECAVLLCGADGTQYDEEAWRLQDLYNCVVKGDFTPNHNVGRVKAIGYDYKFETWEI